MENLRTIYDTHYSMGKPLIHDADYDALFEKDDTNPTDHVSDKPITLPFWMGSLNKIRTENSLKNWISKHANPPFLITEKLDGISGLFFFDKQWKLFSRGNGHIGSDFTHAIPYLFDTKFLSRLDKKIIVRGELIMKLDIFKLKYAKKFKNPRNLVAGIFNRKQIDSTLLSDVCFYVYEIIGSDLKPDEQLKNLKKYGFQTPYSKLVKDLSIPKLTSLYENICSDVSLDGLVIINNNAYLRNESGNPKYAFAFKYDSDYNVVNATVTHVEWNVSKWGVLKPIVHIKPVTMSDVNVSKLTGFNAKFINDNKIGEGSDIIAKRSGNVIPHIISVLSPSSTFTLPNNNWDGVNLISDDLSYVPVKILTNLFEKLGVKFVNIKTIEKLYNSGLTSFFKILKVSNKELLNIVGDKTAKRIISEMKKINSIEISVLIGASGVLGYGVGEKRVGTLFKFIPDFIKKTPTCNTICNVEGFSKTLAEKIIINHPMMLKFIALCEKNNIKIITANVKPLICVTGFRDIELKKYFTISNTLTKKCLYLVVKNQDTKSTKIAKAKELSIKIILKDDLNTTVPKKNGS